MDKSGGYWGSEWYNLKNFLNNNDNGNNTFVDDPWDEGYSPLTYGMFTGDANLDLAQDGGDIIAEAETSGLGEWSSSGLDHFVSVNGWNSNSASVNYVDTAYQAGNNYESNPNGSNTYGNYTASASYFFNHAVMGNASSNDDLW